ncbi:MAG: NAD(P)/FAD-dependent oxidoreductase [Lachnospiraceae bacterium]|nr:NAD(P)/FAD-dependent oxidoreductase [Lachnospiraceae bacterium]
MFDVIIIGGGVIGCSIARFLSRYDRKVCVLERSTDICEGTSKANSGIVHGGYDARTGSMKAKLNLRGSEMMEELSQRLSFAYKRNGSLVLLRRGQDEAGLRTLFDRGIANGVKDLRIIGQSEIREMEPNINEDVVKALYVPTGAIVDPFMLTVAMAENAAVNGVEFRLETEVKDIKKDGADYVLVTGKGDISTKYVINAAGVYADSIHAMVSSTPMSIRAVRGQYCLFDKEVGDLVKHTLFQLPGEKGKGVLVTPTVHGNCMAGPTAEVTDDREGTNTTSEGLSYVLNTGAMSVLQIPGRKIITSFAGLRAKEAGGDFIIKFADDAGNFMDVAGIESPGLSAAPAIGEYVAQLMQEKDPAKEKSDFTDTRMGIPSVTLASDDERQKLIEHDPAFANVICRCELVTEAEIIEAIRRPVGARTVDAVKRRVRAGMGRCQGGFCSPKVVNILARELGVDPTEIKKANKGSEILAGLNKELDGSGSIPNGGDE